MLGAQAFHMALQAIESTETQHEIVLPSTLVVRHSTGPAPT
jgi:DNA-binding LacI/PurR family transcriptional regulator